MLILIFLPILQAQTPPWRQNPDSNPGYQTYESLETDIPESNEAIEKRIERGDLRDSDRLNEISLLALFRGWEILEAARALDDENLKITVVRDKEKSYANFLREHINEDDHKINKIIQAIKQRSDHWQKPESLKVGQDLYRDHSDVLNYLKKRVNVPFHTYSKTEQDKSLKFSWEDMYKNPKLFRNLFYFLDAVPLPENAIEAIYLTRNPPPGVHKPVGFKPIRCQLQVTKDLPCKTIDSDSQRFVLYISPEEKIEPKRWFELYEQELLSLAPQRMEEIQKSLSLWGGDWDFYQSVCQGMGYRSSEFPEGLANAGPKQELENSQDEAQENPKDFSSPLTLNDMLERFSDENNGVDIRSFHLTREAIQSRLDHEMESVTMSDQFDRVDLNSMLDRLNEISNMVTEDAFDSDSHFFLLPLMPEFTIGDDGHLQKIVYVYHIALGIGDKTFTFSNREIKSDVPLR